MATLGFNEYAKRAFLIKELHELKESVKIIERWVKTIQENIDDIWEELSSIKGEY